MQASFRAKRLARAQRLTRPDELHSAACKLLLSQDESSGADDRSAGSTLQAFELFCEAQQIDSTYGEEFPELGLRFATEATREANSNAFTECLSSEELVQQALLLMQKVNVRLGLEEPDSDRMQAAYERSDRAERLERQDMRAGEPAAEEPDAAAELKLGLVRVRDSLDMQSHGNFSGRQCAILCYGDSLTAGYHHGRRPTGPDHLVGLEFEPFAATLRRCLCREGQIRVEHVGASGATAQELLDGLDQTRCLDVARQTWQGLRHMLRHATPSYEMCVIIAGTNDLAALAAKPASEAASTIANRVAALHRCCHEEGTRTLVVAIPPNHFSSQLGTTYAECWAQTNAALEALDFDRGMSSFVDVCQLGASNDMTTPPNLP